MIKVSLPTKNTPKFPCAYQLITPASEHKKLVVLFFGDTSGVALLSEDCAFKVTGQCEGWVSCNNASVWTPVEVKITP